jgi:hypothetical protein
MIGFSVRATDGDLGKVDEFYFDDATWTIRYMVAETGSWLSNRKVLVSLVALGKPDWKSRTFSVNLTCDQIRNSPDIDTERPVYRQHEAAFVTVLKQSTTNESKNELQRLLQHSGCSQRGNHR